MTKTERNITFPITQAEARKLLASVLRAEGYRQDPSGKDSLFKKELIPGGACLYIQTEYPYEHMIILSGWAEISSDSGISQHSSEGRLLGSLMSQNVSSTIEVVRVLLEGEDDDDPYYPEVLLNETGTEGQSVQDTGESVREDRTIPFPVVVPGDLSAGEAEEPAAETSSESPTIPFAPVSEQTEPVIPAPEQSPAEESIDQLEPAEQEPEPEPSAETAPESPTIPFTPVSEETEPVTPAPEQTPAEETADSLETAEQETPPETAEEAASSAPAEQNSDNTFYIDPNYHYHLPILQRMQEEQRQKGSPEASPAAEGPQPAAEPSSPFEQTPVQESAAEQANPFEQTPVQESVTEAADPVGQTPIQQSAAEQVEALGQAPAQEPQQEAPFTGYYTSFEQKTRPQDIYSHSDTGRIDPIPAPPAPPAPPQPAVEAAPQPAVPEKQTVFCMNCGRKLRVRKSEKRLRITCPICRTKFEIEPSK